MTPLCMGGKVNSMSYDKDDIFVDELIGEGLPDLEEEINKMKKGSKQSEDGQDDNDIFAIPNEDDSDEDSIFSIPRQSKNKKEEDSFF